MLIGCHEPFLGWEVLLRHPESLCSNSAGAGSSPPLPGPLPFKLMEPPPSLHPMRSAIIAFIVIKPISIQRSAALSLIQPSDAWHLPWNKLIPGKHIQGFHVCKRSSSGSARPYI